MPPGLEENGPREKKNLELFALNPQVALMNGTSAQGSLVKQ